MLRNKCAACATPLDSQDTTSCVRYLYESSDAWPGCVRCQTRYCSAACRRAHWRDGHEQVCEEIARGGGAEQHYADEKYIEAAEEAIKKCADDTKGQTCYICMDGAETGEGLVRGCACRGAAGFVHLSCLVEDAQVQVEQGLEDEMEHQRPMLVPRLMRYLQCRLCHTDFYGAVAAALGWACWASYVGRLEGDNLRNIALQILGDALKHGKRHAESLDALEANLVRVREGEDYEGREGTIFYVRSQMGDCLRELGRRDECLALRRENYEAGAEAVADGVVSIKAHLTHAIEYCESLNRVDNAAAKAFMRDQDLIARVTSEFGEDHPTTHGCLHTYAFTLIGDPRRRCPDDDLAEATAIFVDIARKWRRRLGAAHPQAEMMQEGAKILQARIAFNGVLDELLAAARGD
ncbi:unnamed protein product [Pelagomonas calceolata]|uniref:MYND-type domain-containing protein n=1 Tax=Pelagomonas calceolata TaxID=35677 RepID=A0A8J2WYW0_9STRA|nr:unnamed protein product [Pelagomonas calceolata]